MFRVVEPLAGPDTSRIPAAPQPITRLDPANAAQTREIELSETLDPATGFPTMLLLEGRAWHEPVTITPKLGTTEVWRFVNTTADTHPMHTHLTQFQVLGRQAFDVPAYLETGKLVLEALHGVNVELGAATAIITHNVAIARMGNRVVHLADGRISRIDVNDAPARAADISW